MRKILLKCYLFTLSRGWQWLKNLHYFQMLFQSLSSMHWRVWQRDENSKVWTQDIARYPDAEKKLIHLTKGLETIDKEFIYAMYQKIQLIADNNVLEYTKIFSTKEEKEQKAFAKFCLKYPTPYFGIDKISSWLNIFYAMTLSRIPYVKEYVQNKIILDCGGYIADTALTLSEKLSPKKVYTFEPNLENFNQARKTILDNSQQDIIIPIKSGVGKKNYQAIISQGGAGSKILDGELGEKIEVVSIDNFMKENKGKVGLIKRDIEGLEYESVLGAEKTIKEDKPILLISIYHSGKDFFEIKPLLESWNLGYIYTFFRWNCFHPFADILLVAYPKDN